jgi:hypothetical protein
VVSVGYALRVVFATLQQNIDDITVLIHGTPKILLLTVDSDEEFAQIPGMRPCFFLRRLA